jgi:hypothetical protein
MSYIGQGLPADVFAGFTIDKFTGTGVASQALTLTKAPLGETALLVTIDGVVQEPTDDFTVSGTTVTIVGTAPLNSEINVTHLSGTVPSTLASKVDVNGVSDAIILDADADTTISADTDDQIDIKTGGTDRLKIQSTSGNNVVIADGLTLTDGNITFSGSGHGIHLGVTTATAANLLDDYEEGTFTASYGSSGSDTGYYTKVGRLVTINLILIDNDSGFNTITGLPFASLAGPGYAVTFGRILGVNSRDRSNLGGNVSDSQINIYNENATTTSIVTTSTTRVDMTAFYLTS